MAGAAHADTYTVSAGRRDDGTLSGERLAELLRPTTNLMIGRTESPINAGPQQHYVAQAALWHLVQWVTDGMAPPSAPRLRLDDAGTGYRLDEHGQRAGRHPDAMGGRAERRALGPGPDGESFAVLFGRTVPFDEAELAALYPGGEADYLARFESALDAAIDARYLLEQDRDGDPRRGSRVVPAASRRLARSSETLEEPTAYASERVRWCLVSACGSLPS